jgi:hypothetical protein
MATLLLLALIVVGLFVLSGCAAAVAPSAAAPAGLPDGVAGDSIAQGTGAAMHVATWARKSMSSCWILHHLPDGHFEHFVVSAGVNDVPGRCVPKIAAWMHAHARHGYWLVGYGAGETAMVVNSAAAYGQIVLFFVTGPDHVHPRSYP